MTLEEAIEYFGSGYNLTKQLGVSRQCFTRWNATKKIPLIHQYRIEKITGGKLTVDEELVDYVEPKGH